MQGAKERSGQKAGCLLLKTRGPIYGAGTMQEAQGKLMEAKLGNAGPQIRCTAGNKLHGVVRREVSVEKKEKWILL